MNENLDLTQVLKDCPKGVKLYSPIFGEVEFEGVAPTERIIINTKNGDEDLSWFVCRDGKAYDFAKNGEVMLFPSKDQRDWSKFNPNLKPKFKVGHRIVDIVRKNNHTYKVLEVLEDRYKVTGFDTLLFCDQDEFELAAVQIEMLEPPKVYWFVWKEGVTEPLLDELMRLSDSGYRPYGFRDGQVVFNVQDEIFAQSCMNTNAMLATMFGTRLSIKEEK